LAKEIDNHGITVNNIAPGPLDTSFFYPTVTSDSNEYFKQQSINGKLEIKDIVPLAKWQTIFINGRVLTRSVSYLASIGKVEDGGPTIFGKFHSDQ